MSEPVAAIAARLAAELGVPLRARGIRYEGGFYGQTGKGEPYPAGIEPGHLVELIEALPPGRTELGCHPGIGDDTESSYASERERGAAGALRPAGEGGARAGGDQAVLLCPDLEPTRSMKTGRPGCRI